MGPVVAREEGLAQGAKGCAPALRSPASDLRARILALQRTAGNRAVADLVGRRMLQRSSTLTATLSNRRKDDVDSVQHLLEKGTSRLVDAVEPDPGVVSTEEMDLVAPEEVAVSDAPQTMVPATPPPRVAVLVHVALPRST